MFDFLTDCLLSENMVEKSLIEEILSTMSLDLSFLIFEKFPTLDDIVIRLIFQLRNERNNISKDLCEHYLKTSMPNEILFDISL
jgi:hypothetical protein